MSPFPRLYIVFENALEMQMHPLEEIDFVDGIITEYFRDCIAQGLIVNVTHVDLREDLKTEIWVMLRKKIYGHYDLKAYLRSRNSKQEK